MRRLLLAAAIGAVVLGAAGCSTDQTPSAGVTPQAGVPAGAGATLPGAVLPGASLPGASLPGGASAPANGSKPGGAAGANAGDAALAGNTQAICNQAAKTGGQFGSMFAQDVKLLIDAESAKDQDLSGKVKQKTARDVENYSFALNDMSKLAADPTVKQALADMSKQMTALKGDVRKIDDKKLDQLRATLDKACGT
jgi:hypothetical protein